MAVSLTIALFLFVLSIVLFVLQFVVSGCLFGIFRLFFLGGGGGGFSGWYYVVRVRGTKVSIKKSLEDKKENGDMHKTHIWFPERCVFVFKLWHCSAIETSTMLYYV
jgi:hypothetical protein